MMCRAAIGCPALVLQQARATELSEELQSMQMEEVQTETGTAPRSEASFVSLVVEHTPAVYRLARSVVQDSALADDVVQDTFIQVWKHQDQFRGEGSMRGWILRIAHNTAVSTLRRIKDSAVDPQRFPERPDPIGVSRVVEGRAALVDLQAALQNLDDLSREIVVLREVEGMSYDEIADTLEVPIPTVKTRLLRARRQLSTTLEGWKS